MIIQKEIKIDETYYMYAFSDSGLFISRDGKQYIDALDPHFLGREYEETETKLSSDEINTLLINQKLDLSWIE